MRFALITAALLSMFGATIAAHAEGEGSGDPFPFRAPGIVTVGPSVLADTGSAAYPDFSSRPGQIVADGQGMLPPNGSEGTVQAAASLPRGFLDATSAVMQAKSVDRLFAMAAARRSATYLHAHTSHG
jgi:hypothetical protein